MPDQWPLVDRSCAKRSSDECVGLFAKKQKRDTSFLEEALEWEDILEIRGGLSDPAPPGSPPNRATNSGSQGNTENPPGSASYIVEEADDYEEPWRAESAQQNTTTPLPPAETNRPGVHGQPDHTQHPARVDNPSTPNPHGQQLPTPPQTNPSATRQGGGTGAAATPGGPAATTAEALQSSPTENEILDLFDKLQQIVTLWVEECLPDVFPPEFQTTKPERYWELCGWTRPMSALGQKLLQNRSWAKYVYESWVWRFLHQEIFDIDSLAWAGFDAPIGSGGLGGVGRTTNMQFGFLKEGVQKINRDEYQRRIESRAATMRRVREEGAVTANLKVATTGWLVEEMLIAFYPYFADGYKPLDRPENMEVLIRDTRFVVLKAQELDEKLRSARHAYEMIVGKEDDPVRIGGIPPPAMQSYHGGPNGVRVLRDDYDIALIVVPGLVKNTILEPAYSSPQLSKEVRRYARAFTQTDLFNAIQVGGAS